MLKIQKLKKKTKLQLNNSITEATRAVLKQQIKKTHLAVVQMPTKSYVSDQSWAVHEISQKPVESTKIFIYFRTTADISVH